MASLTTLDILSAASALRAGDMSSEDLTRGFLDRIEQVDPSLHAFYAVTADHALTQARKADEARSQGADLGALHGVPIAVKDLYETTFAPTTGGLSHRRGFVAAQDCHVVQRLEAAGAVILGKLATTEGAGLDHNPEWPTPVNPWSAAHWTGISSSGSGVAVAARLCLGALGSDTGGSIRLPAAACGVTGLKPTFGRVNGAGVMDLAQGFDHFGPITQSAADAAVMLQAIAGRDSGDPRTGGAPDAADYVGSIDGGVKGVRIGVDRDVLENRTDSAIAVLLETALREIELAGAVLVPVRLPATDELMVSYSQVLARQAAGAHAQWFDAHEAGYGAVLGEMVRRGRALDEVSLFRAQERCARWSGELAELMLSVDTLAVPVLANPVPRLAAMVPGQPSGIGTFTIPFNVSGSPAINFPVGFDPDGLPVSLQLVGRHWDEAVLLRAGHSYQKATEWHRMVPPAAN